MRDARTLVAWDDYCKLYVPLADLKHGCPSGEVNEWGRPHKLRKRRMFICPGCKDAFFEGDVFIDHIERHMSEHWSEAI